MPKLTMPHRRFNPLLDEWVLCSPQRLARPWQGQLESRRDEPLPAYDPGCYLCPGNLRASGERNPRYGTTFAFDNDFPALRPRHDLAPESSGLLRAQPEAGRCRVLCFSPRHDLTVAQLDDGALRGVVQAWIDETEALAGAREFAYVQIFENKGELMGCSNPHPHCQVWATQHVPTGPARRLEGQRRHWERQGSDLLGDYLGHELREQERVVCRNEHWVALVPFWAVWPFETMLLPVRHVGGLPLLSGEERDALAEMLGRLNARYDNLFDCSFPYSMAWHGQPSDGESHPWWRLHATYYPPLLRSATVRKFLVGYELAAEPQRDLTPEEAAARLRSLPETRRAAGAAPGRAEER
jgi:UDPglucose--hexose-1-phosphate uridylyltransferase